MLGMRARSSHDQPAHQPLRLRWHSCDRIIVVIQKAEVSLLGSKVAPRCRGQLAVHLGDGRAIGVKTDFAAQGLD
jgi:hypothetical protein